MSPQFKSGGGDVIHISGYEESHSCALTHSLEVTEKILPKILMNITNTKIIANAFTSISDILDSPSCKCL